MVFSIECEDQKLKVEAESAVQAIIKIIEFEKGTLSNSDFKVKCTSRADNKIKI